MTDAARLPARPRRASPRIETAINLVDTDPTGLGRYGRLSFQEFDGLPTTIEDRMLQSQLLMIDPRVRQLVNRRADAIAARRLKVEPPKGGRRKNWDEEVSGLWRVFNDSGYENLVDDLFREALLPGFSVAAIDPWIDNKKKVRSLKPWIDPNDKLAKFRYRIPRNFQNRFQFVYPKPDDDTPLATSEPYDPQEHEIVKFHEWELRLRVKGRVDGLRCPTHRFILFSMSRTSPLDGGLAPVLWALTEFQQAIQGAAKAIACRAESPPLIIKYPHDDPAFDEGTAENPNLNARALLDRLEALGKAVSPYGYALIPDSVIVEAMDKIASFEPAQAEYWMGWCDRMKMIAVLGEVSASEMEFGSRALAESIVDDRNSTTVDRDADWRDGQLAEFNRCLFAAPDSLNRDRFTALSVSTEKASDLRMAEAKQEEEAVQKAIAERQSIQADLLIKMQEAGYVADQDWIKENLGEQWALPTIDPNAESVTQTALRGTQLEGILTIVDAARTGKLDRDGAIALLLVAFPIDRPTAEQIIPQEAQPVIEPEPEAIEAIAPTDLPPTEAPQFAAMPAPTDRGVMSDQEFERMALISLGDIQEAREELEEEG